MEKYISLESFIDIIWSTIKKFVTDKSHSFVFDSLSDYFKKNGFVLNHKSLTMIEELFRVLGNNIRDYVLDMGNYDERCVEESCRFIQDAMIDLAQSFEIPIISSEEGALSHFKNYIEKDFSKMKVNNTSFGQFKSPEEYLAFLDSPTEKLERLKALPRDEALMEICDIKYPYPDPEVCIRHYVFGNSMPLYDLKENGISKNDVTGCLMLLQNLPYLRQQFNKIYKIHKQLNTLERNLELSVFYENPKFIHDCKKLIISLDKADRYHETISSALKSIEKNGLFMVSDSLDSTSHAIYKISSSCDIDERLNSLLLFHHGIEVSRGGGIVFIKANAKVLPASDEGKRTPVMYSLSGPIGINYKIAPGDIIGTIDTITQNVTFGNAFEKSDEKEL